jgi:hypothetical protein
MDERDELERELERYQTLLRLVNDERATAAIKQQIDRLCQQAEQLENHVAANNRGVGIGTPGSRTTAPRL